MKIKNVVKGLLLGAFLSSNSVYAESYVIDTDRAHAFIHFKIGHLGFSYILGRFERFEGSFEYDPSAPESASVEVTIDAASINSNLAERDNHLRRADFLDTDTFKQARFVSTKYSPSGNSRALLSGDLTLHGVTKNISLDVTEVGAGADPWGGYRRGFTATTTLTLADFGISRDLGPSSREVEVTISLEGVRR